MTSPLFETRKLPRISSSHLWNTLELGSFTFRTRRGDVSRHRSGEVFDVAAGGATPAHVARFFARFEPDDDRVEAVAHLLERLAQRDNVLVVGHYRERK